MIVRFRLRSDQDTQQAPIRSYGCSRQTRPTSEAERRSARSERDWLRLRSSAGLHPGTSKSGGARLLPVTCAPPRKRIFPTWKGEGGCRAKRLAQLDPQPLAHLTLMPLLPCLSSHRFDLRRKVDRHSVPSCIQRRVSLAGSVHERQFFACGSGIILQCANSVAVSPFSGGAGFARW